MPPILERGAHKSIRPLFFFGNHHISGSRTYPIEASTLGDLSGILEDRETNIGTEKETANTANQETEIETAKEADTETDRTKREKREQGDQEEGKQRDKFDIQLFVFAKLPISRFSPTSMQCGIRSRRRSRSGFFSRYD